MGSLFFSTIEVTRQVFFRSPLSFAIVNLKPIVPGHVLVIPTRPVRRITDLKTDELASLMSSVQSVGRVIERAYGADALTVACQDGPAAGQSVPHVHFHLLPRKASREDPFFSRNDHVYPAIEKAEATLPNDLHAVAEKPPFSTATTPRMEALSVDADEDRKRRTTEEMEKEAQWLKSFFEAENREQT